MIAANARGGAPEPFEAFALPQHQPAPETAPTAILARARAILGDMTTGEAEAWRQGYAAGERQAMEVLLPMLKAARAELAAARGDAPAGGDTQP